MKNSKIILLILPVIISLAIFFIVDNSQGFQTTREYLEPQTFYSNNNTYSFVSNGKFLEKINGTFKEKWDISGKKGIDELNAINAILTTDGKYIVTYGNLGITTRFPHDVVIYNGKNGNVIKRYLITILN